MAACLRAINIALQLIASVEMRGTPVNDDFVTAGGSGEAWTAARAMRSPKEAITLTLKYGGVEKPPGTDCKKKSS